MAIGVPIDTFLVRTALVPGLTLAVGPVAGCPGRRWTKQGEPVELVERVEGESARQELLPGKEAPESAT